MTCGALQQFPLVAGHKVIGEHFQCDAPSISTGWYLGMELAQRLRRHPGLVH